MEKLRKPDLIIFDWDHTLVAAPINVTERDIDGTLAYYKRSIPSDIVAQFPRQEMIFSLPIIMFEHEDEPCMEWFKIPGSQEILDYFTKQNVDLAIVSNKERLIIQLEVKVLKWRQYFRTVVARGDAPRAKPAPDLLFVAAAKCNIAPGQEVWFIGDSRVDTQAANAAGYTPIHYRYRADDVLNSAIYREYMDKYENVHPIGDGEQGAKYAIDDLRELIMLYDDLLSSPVAEDEGVLIQRDSGA